MADSLPDAATCYELLARMALIRRFEEEAGRQYQRAKAGGFLHLAIGEEATIVGTTSVMRDEDFLIGTYRTHGHAIARGTEPKRVMAELFGRVDGTSGGRGGSMHIFDAEHRFMGGYGIVGGNLPIAAGLAPRLPVQGRRRGHRLHVRRRRLQHRQLRRDDEPGGALEAAGPLPGREQPLRDGDRGRAPLGPDRPLQEGRGLRDPRHAGRRDGRARGARGGRRGHPGGARGATGRPCSRPSPTATAATPPPTPRSTGSARRSRSGARRTRSRPSPGAASRPGCWASARSKQAREAAEETVVAAVEFAEASPEPALDTMYENLYALDRPGRLVRGRRAQPGAAPRRARGRRCPTRRASWPRPAPPTPSQPRTGARPNPALQGDAQDGTESRTEARPRLEPTTPRRRGLMAELRMREALRDAMAEEMRRDEARLRDGRGRRRLPGRLQGDRGAARRVRRAPRARHADLREHDRRHRGRRGDGRPAADRRADDRQLLAAGAGPDRQPRRRDPLHVQRPGAGADGDPDAGRRRPPARPDPLAQLRGALPAGAGPAGRLPLDPGRRQGAAEGGDPRRQPGRSSSSTRASTGSAARSPDEARTRCCASARRRCGARAAT